MPDDTAPDETFPQLKARLAKLPADSHGKRHIDLFIVTHIDHDHIDAAKLQRLRPGQHPSDETFPAHVALVDVLDAHAVMLVHPEFPCHFGVLLALRRCRFLSQAFGGFGEQLVDQRTRQRFEMFALGVC